MQRYSLTDDADRARLAEAMAADLARLEVMVKGLQNCADCPAAERRNALERLELVGASAYLMLPRMAAVREVLEAVALHCEQRAAGFGDAIAPVPVRF